MSKGLEALENLYKESNRDFGWERDEQHKSDKVTIEKELKALEIIKNIGILKPYETIGGQCWLEAMCDATKITKDNYDLLKEVLL